MSAIDIKSEEISARDKRALLAELLRQRASQPVVAPTSFAQQRLWFLDQLEPGSLLYNVSSAVRLQGAIDVAALERSFEFMVRRHETLRTTFDFQDGKPVQVIAPQLELVIERCEDFSRSDATAQPEAISQLLEKEALRPFDLASGPLLRVKLLRLGAEDHVLSLTMHHIISDGWSMGVLIGELVSLYEAFSKGESVALPELPIQYADFARWQREWLTGDVLEKQLAYWQRQLDDVTTLQLPTDRPRPSIRSHHGSRQDFSLPREISESLLKLARNEGVTLFTLLLAAWQTLLARYTGQTDIVVGSPIANRNRLETEGLIGFFVNTLVLRTDLTGNPTFRELLERVRSVVLDAQEHQDVPFEKIVEELQLERSLSHTPLFQVVFALHTAPAPGAELRDVKLATLDVQRHTAKFDLMFELFELNGNINGSLEYSTDLFDDTTITRLLGHYRGLLAVIVENPERRILDLPLLSHAEEQELVYDWNEVAPQAEPEQLLHELFEVQVQRTPGNVALVLEDEVLTYGELNARADELAQELRELGVGPETLVGIFMERSIEMVVAVLGILKAGGAYVPLDIEHPKERLAFMLEDAEPPVLLTQRRLVDRLPELTTVKAVYIDERSSRDGARVQTSGNVPLRQRGESPAYVIYTSGSTGTPKGVVITHANVVRLFTATRTWFNFNVDDVWTLFHSYAFDFSVWELWGALLYGGRLVIVPYLVSRQPEAFYQLLLKERVTVLNQTPSAFRQLIQAEQSSWPNASEAPPLALRFVIFGGEALELQSLGPWFERHGDEQPLLVNMYGITETTVHVTYRPIREQDLSTATGSVIGERIPDLQIYVLDAARKPVPVGVPGELYVGGAGIARGYLHRPALTAERFVTHPWGEAGARLYRTGDRGRYLANGDLEYLGRVDRQVKVRGFRIELGEIEAVLAQQANVSESVVIARDDDGDTRLVAYVVTEQDLTVSDLRNHMKERLPEYMVPSAFVLLDKLPLTTNGKVDRRALPSPEDARLNLGEAYVAPESEAEQILVDVWAEVLKVERVGVCDNYFTLGGDSIRSVNVLSLARERGLNFTLPQLFQHQTIRELARAATSETVSASATRTTPFSLLTKEDRLKLPDDVIDAYPLSRLQSGMLYHLEATSGVSVYHNINSYHLKARLNEEVFVQAVQQVVARHDVLRTSFDLSSYSEALQLVHKEAELPVGFEDLRHLSPAAQDEVIKAYVESEQQNRFDLSRSPLLRFHIHRTSDDTFQFTLTENHAILDGWSLQSTLAEIFQVYFALLRNESLPEQKPFATSFREFIALEQAALESEECQRFWQENLSDATVTEIIPWSSEPIAANRQRARNLVVNIPDEVSQGLHRLAVNAAVPIKSVLLAAHLKVMSMLMGQSDVITGVVCNGRPEEADGDLIRGLFLNVIPFRQHVHAQTWTEFVRETFNAERNMLPFRRYPLPAIQEQMNTPSFFETTFNYVHYHVLDGVLGSGDVQVLQQVEGYEETNFMLNAGFMSHVLSSRVLLRVAVDPKKVGEEQSEAIRGYYERVLAAMARNVAGPLETELLLDEAERRKVLVEWNDTVCDFPSDKCFQQLFEEQVERTPAAEAVVFGEQRLSYRDLNRNANQLAHQLRSLGVGPETPVGISVERSIEMVAGILGILKAGGAFVPLDPTYPRDRLAFMIEDSGIEVLLTQARLVDALPPYRGKIVHLDRLDTSYSSDNLDLITTSQNAAYVIYTSGSTGTPKGVVLAHRGLCNLATAQIHAFNVQPSDRVLQFAALSYDASVFELAMALPRGATLVVAPREDLLPGERLISLLREQGITNVTLPPSVLALLPPEEFPTLRTIVVAGEACWAELVQRWAVYGRRFFNAYGPTETTVWISVAECVADGAKPPIGQPIANVQVYVLDENMRPAPLGVPGELFAGGEGVARGYLDRPDLTAARFVPDPFSTAPGGARLYRTGDLVRYLPSGQLEFLGRVDQQVKLRGFRIELGEIEAMLCRHEAVTHAVVLKREERLVAYVVLRADHDTSELRQFLQQHLPEHMMPSAWVMLDALPVTAGGKVDRRALPAPDSQRPELPSAYIAPRSEIEQEIAAVWQEVLGIDDVGVTDNFFDLGGHSLQAVQVHGKLRAKFEKNLLLFELFQFPTIAAMAKYINDEYVEESAPEQGIERAETRKELRSRRRRKAAGEF